MIAAVEAHMKTFNQVLISVLLAAQAFAQTSPAPAPESMAALEKKFRELPADTRLLTGPLFWLHGDESKERLDMYVQKIAEGGNGCFTAESRPHNDWLGAGWWRDLGICLDAAKKNNLQMWIFDEKMWPSQAVGGKVPPIYAAKQLVASVIDVEGPRNFEADGYSGDRYIGTVAAQVSPDGKKLLGNTLMDLEVNVLVGRLSWSVPGGKWRIIKFSHQLAPALIQSGGKELTVDGASKDCVDWYVKTVYQAHYDQFKDDFGKTIRGYFYDEPEVSGDWGTELNAVLTERKVDWKKAYVAYKFQLDGDEQAAARYQYLDAFTEAWGRTMYGGITKWCHAHGVKSIGHFMEHANLYYHPKFCGGDMMRLQKYSDMGGIDAVFNQFAPYQRVIRDAPCWQTPKLGSSISHAYGKPNDLAMVEIFGARGQDLGYPEMKWWLDHMQVSGINFIIPHSFNPRAPKDTDCPPYFYNGGFEPRWPLYRVFADYSSRLSLMLTGGRHVCPVALLWMGQSAQVGKFVAPDQISEALQDALFDCDWLPYEVFESKNCKFANKSIKLREEAYRILVIPPVEVIPYSTLAKAKQFFDQGGVVVAYNFLPTKSATLGRDSVDIAQLREAIWGKPKPGLNVCKTSRAGGRSYFLPAAPKPEHLQQALTRDAGIHPTLLVTEGQTENWLHVLHRVKDGHDVFFIVNQSPTAKPKRFRFRVTAAGVPECWDAVRNEITSVPFSRKGNEVELTLSMERNQSVLLVFQENKRALPLRFDSTKTNSVGSEITLVREPNPPQPENPYGHLGAATVYLKKCSWVWHPQAPKPEVNAPAGTCYFRKHINISKTSPILSATFFGTADNSFKLYVNGQPAGGSEPGAENWRNPVELDIAKLLRPGGNDIAIEATNSKGGSANPAGLIGRVKVDFQHADPMFVKLDKTWKVSNEKISGWNSSKFDDAAWLPAKECVPFGAKPWGILSAGITLSPATADPFVGNFEITDKIDLKKVRVLMDAERLSPENACRVTVNGAYAGGFIGRPLRMDLTDYVKPGTNTISVEPFAPQALRVFTLPR